MQSFISQILGVIKGSEESLAYENGFLDRKGYEGFSDRMQPAFSSHRVAIYQIFQSYLKLKQERGDYDAADRFLQLNCFCCFPS
jgi:hypothetical protein